jgi:diguanylate cyclase (GGDEF)-like protein/PAS domain S-box-containing protein
LQNFRRTLEKTLDSIFVFDPKTLQITYANEGASRQVGVTPHSLTKRFVTDLISRSRLSRFRRQVEKILREKHTSSIFETSLLNAKGRETPAEVLLQYIKTPNQAPQLLAIVRDLTERRRSQSEIRRAVLRDTLTGLPNRLLFNERLSKMLEKSKRSKHKFAVIFIDLDRFKFINDTLGHVMGDLLLRNVAKRLQSSLKKTDAISRLGGDEFVILLNNIGSRDNVESVANRIRESFKEPFKLAGQEVYLNVSMGISSYPEDGSDGDTLLKNADNALYRAKQRGGSSHEYYFPELQLPQFSHFELDRDLRMAIKNVEFEFEFQPIFELAGPKKIVEVEALLRWRHNRLGVMLPHAFIRHLEESGLISQLTEWQLENICKTLETMKAAGKVVPVALNISARQILQQDFFKILESILQKHGIDPKFLKLELTETLLIKNPEASHDLLSELKSMGITVMVDDFGTGYASLSYLKQLPVSGIKIDQSFIQNMVSNKTDLAIIKAILALGENLGMKVVAEGVETLKQHRMLKMLKCSFAQGNWYSKPMSQSTLMHMLVKKKSWKAKL